MSTKYILRYDKPADRTVKGWENESLPIGNGYQGASICGGIDCDRLYLNEESLWTGGPISENGVAQYKNNDFLGLTNRSGFTVKKESIDKARIQGLGDNNQKIVKTFIDEIVSDNRKALGAYQSFAILDLEFSHGGIANDYERQLNIESAIAKTHYRIDGTVYNREYIASYPKRVIEIKIDKKGKETLDFKLNIIIPHIECGEVTDDNRTKFGIDDYGKVIHSRTYKAGIFSLLGHLRQNGLRFALVVKVETDGTTSLQSDSIIINGANKAVIYLSMGTDYNNDYSKEYRTKADIISEVRNRVINASKQGYNEIYKEHIADYTAIFNKSRLCLFNGDTPKITTDRLIKAYPFTKYARYIEELYYNYGRYLLIASSRKNTLPANLQGVWNVHQLPPWSSDYHLNINLQMNYWTATRTNMSETFIPLIDFVEKRKEPGRIAAKTLFGIDCGSNGLAANIFGYVGVGDPWTLDAHGFPSWSQSCYAWLCHSVYEGYLYYGDETLLKERIYPLLCDCANFYSELLIFDKKTGRMVISPSYSAEHGPMYAGCTFEQDLVWQIFEDYLDASEILNDKSILRDKVCKLQKLLNPLVISKKTGRIKEWYNEDDIKIVGKEPFHRHISHLIGLFPCNHIKRDDELLIKSAKKTLKKRGNKGTGWSRAFKIGLNARLGDADKAYKNYRSLIAHCTHSNLWDSHPPFQIDGNFGGVAGVAEMLLGSEKGVIYPLPALPKAWRNGMVEGLNSYGGVIVDIEWHNNQPTRLRIHNRLNAEFVICFKDFSPQKILINKQETELCGNNLKFDKQSVEGDIEIVY